MVFPLNFNVSILLITFNSFPEKLNDKSYQNITYNWMKMKMVIDLNNKDTKYEKTTLLTLGLILGYINLNADVIPGINSKAGAMLLPEGKTKMFYKYMHFDRNNMYDGSSQVPNLKQLDAAI
jgi:hypothetical protein